MITSSTQPPGSSRPVQKLWRLLAAIFVFAATAAVALAALRLPSLGLQQVVAETLLIERIAPWVLAGAALLFACSCLRATSRGDLLLALWLGTMASLAAFRELDAHVLLNPGNIHLLGLQPDHGVRFRLDWWISSSTSILVRIAWAILALLLGLLLTLPLIHARIPWLTRVAQRDTLTLLLGAAAAVMAAGYIIDDLIARAVPSPAAAAIVEETLELIGELLLLSAAALMFYRITRSREAASATSPYAA